MVRKLFLFFILILIIAVLLVPSQSDYFQRLESDFGVIHHSHSLNKGQLKEQGDFMYRNRLVFSQFNYSIGEISVSYYGFFNIILLESAVNKEQNTIKITV